MVSELRVGTARQWCLAALQCCCVLFEMIVGNSGGRKLSVRVCRTKSCTGFQSVLKRGLCVLVAALLVSCTAGWPVSVSDDPKVLSKPDRCSGLWGSWFLLGIRVGFSA